MDFSAGWGDRLVSAIAYDCSYVGVDPNPCLHPLYKKIINTLAKNKKKFKLYQSPFESVNLKEKDFDLVFTSPPFFKLESYSNDSKQSDKKYTTLDDWFNKFLVVSVIKSKNLLIENGKLALYISDYTKIKYVDRLKKYIEKNINDLIYQGDIHWQNDKKKIRTILIWEKKKA